MTDDATGARPMPQFSPLTEPFWQAAQDHRLMVQRCLACMTYRFPPEVGCFQCGSLESEWTEASGRAALYTWTVAHPPLLPYFRERAPWPVAVVELEEGPRLVTSLTGIEPVEYRIGMPLVADFEAVSDDVTLVVFMKA